MADDPQRAFSAVILAGGEGSRMGCDKALLTFRGRPMLERVVRTLREETLRGLFDEMLVVGRKGVPGTSSQAGAAQERFLEPLFVPDAVGGAGPLGGIATGLRHMKSQRGLFVACDMPLLDARVIEALLTEASGVDADAVVPVHDGRREPLHAVYSKGCLPAAERLIASGDLRAHALSGEVRTHYWDARAAGFDARSFTNVNTKEDLAALEGTGE